MSSFEPHEVAAVAAGGCAGGEYLESIGKFGMDQLTPAEWQCFCECICRGYEDSKATPLTESDIPY